MPVRYKLVLWLYFSYAHNDRCCLCGCFSHLPLSMEFCTDSNIFEGSLTKWHVCRGRRNVSFWLDFITDFHRRYSKEKNRILKREIVSEAVDKWISSGGRFLMKCSGGYRFVILPSEQISLAAHYFRNFRSMGMLRRSNTPRKALPNQVSHSNTMDVSAAASAEMAAESDAGEIVSEPDVAELVSEPDASSHETQGAAEPHTLLFGDNEAKSMVPPILLSKRRSQRILHLKTKGVDVDVVGTFECNSSVLTNKIAPTEKSTTTKKSTTRTARKKRNKPKHVRIITPYLRRTSKRLRLKRSLQFIHRPQPHNFVEEKSTSNHEAASVGKSRKRKRKLSSNVPNVPIDSSNQSNDSGDVWHPQRRPSGVELLPLYRRGLANAGIQHWYDYAANLFSHYEATKAKVLRSTNRLTKGRYVKRGAIQRQLRLHRHISKVRQKYDTERDHWGLWLLDGEHRGFSSIWTMQLTLSSSDVVVKPIVEHLISNLQFQGPKSVLDAVSAKDNSYDDAVASLASHISTCINYRKASAIVSLAVICILIGKVPSSYAEIVSVPWVGPKCAYEALKEGFGCEDAGVGCDIHMCRMFGVLGWSDPVTYFNEFDYKNQKPVSRERYNHDRTSMQIMSWVPRRHWGEMNHIYAGLGQLLQKSDSCIRSAIRNDLLNVPERWMFAKVSSILSLPQYSYASPPRS